MNARDACLNETLALILLSEQLERATDAVVRAVLTRLSDDETRHAILAFQIAAWTIQIGGKKAQREVADALHRAPTVEVLAGFARKSPRLEGHGWLSPRTRELAVRRGYVEVVRPALEAPSYARRRGIDARALDSPAGRVRGVRRSRFGKFELTKGATG